MSQRKRKIGIALFISGLALLCTLCVWQVYRGLEKQDIQERFNLHADDKTTLNNLTDNDFSSLLYQEVKFNGEWINDGEVWIENRLYKGRRGYEVLKPWRLPNGSVIWVNLGWFLEPAQRVDVITSASDVIKGVLYQPETGFFLGDNLREKNKNKLIVQQFDSSLFNETLVMNALPYALIIDSLHKDAGVRIWQPYAITAEKHFGYALQWGGLAITLLIFGFIWFREILWKKVD